MKNLKSCLSDFLNTIRRFGFSRISILLFTIVVIATIFNNNRWKTKHGLVIHDVVSYYSYLPAAIIHGDMKFRFNIQFSMLPPIKNAESIFGTMLLTPSFSTI